MISSKLIDLLKTFSEEEFRKFGLYVSSPYFNKENIQVKFYAVLKKYYPDFENRNFEKEKVFRKLYPEKKYNDGVMRNILSTMLQLAEDFLRDQNLRKNEFNLELSLMKELDERKMDKLFEKAEIETERLLENRAAKDENYYYDKYLLLSEKRANRSMQKSSLYGTELLLNEISESLAVFFMINTLRTITQLANSNFNMFSTSNSVIFANEIEMYLDKEFLKYKDVTYIRFYYNAFKLAKTKEEKYFFALRTIADSDYEKLTILEKRGIFTLLTNYCYYMIGRGDLKFRKEHFLIHKENIESGNYKGDMPYLSHILYLNVIVTGIEAGELSWVEQFIEQYKDELDEINRENTYNFSHALLNYHHKNYDKALLQASKVKTDDHSYKHQLKSLYLKIYFEMNDAEPFYSHIDSYKHFLQNDKNISEQMKLSLLNYVNFSKRLFDITGSGNDKDFEINRLKREIDESRAALNKTWLLQKIEEISQ